MNQLGVVLLLWLLPLRLDFLPGVSTAWISRDVARTEIAVLQDVTDDLRTRLHIAEQVNVEIVDHNPLVMSVAARKHYGEDRDIVITIDRGYIHDHNPTETEAAIAHELGHVWIYTHAPFVQTERLANDVAMRVINRSAFEPVYEKVWARTGIRGNLIEFLGPPSQD